MINSVGKGNDFLFPFSECALKLWPTSVNKARSIERMKEREREEWCAGEQVSKSV